MFTPLLSIIPIIQAVMHTRIDENAINALQTSHFNFWTQLVSNLLPALILIPKMPNLTPVVSFMP